MYLPAMFQETRPAVLRELIAAHPLGALVTTSQGALNAEHIPFDVVPGGEPFVALRGHVARSNPLVAAGSTPAGESLVIFQGPAAYVSPSHYPSKQVAGKVVPTWNYAVVHVYGRLRFVHDPSWLLDLVTSLTRQQERNRAQPWHVSDAPASFIDPLLEAIVGVELEVTRVLGKWKMSQNRSAVDRAGVVDGLGNEVDGAARAVAAWMRDNPK